jgi:hypothetical protein
MNIKVTEVRNVVNNTYIERGGRKNSEINVIKLQNFGLSQEKIVES